MLGCIIQARMGSSRLQGKVMMKIDKQNPLIYYVIKQLQYCKHLEKIVVATTNLKEDDVIADYVSNMGIECFQGNQYDVLDRYYQCAKKFDFSIIVRITSDSPLIDPHIVDMAIEKFNSNSYDYLTNSVPRTFPLGISVEVFSFDALENAWKNAILPSEREHVTPYFYNTKDKFRIFNLEHTEDLSHLRWTVDRKADLDLIRQIVSKIKKRPILLDDIVSLFKKEPYLIEINKNLDPDEGYKKSLKEDEIFRATKYEKNN